MASTERKPCIHCGECCMESVCPIGEIFMGTTDPPCPALVGDKEGKFWCGLVVCPEKVMYAKTDYSQWWAGKLGKLLATNVFKFGDGCDRP